MKVLIIGDGLLGSELKRQNPTWGVISRRLGTLDINDDKWVSSLNGIDVVINCIAHTNTYDQDKTQHLKLNVDWVGRLADVCRQTNSKLVHISTDYMYANTGLGYGKESDIPMHHKSWYGYTKLIGESIVQSKITNHLIIRCGHKPRPFPYDKATTAIVGNFDYVDVIAEKIERLISLDAHGIVNVGSDFKTMYDLAIQTNPDVEKIDYLPVETMPTDVRMNLSKYNQIIGH